jgi:hypothetical protein
MSNVQFSNFAATTLASGINASVTSLTVATGTGALFPTLAGSQYFFCVLADAATGTTREVIKVTARSTDVFTVTRAQDGTTGQTYITGDKVELRLTAAGLATLATIETAQTFAGVQTFSSDAAFTSTGAVQLPASTTGNRPTGVTGKIRYNTTTSTFEGYGASTWGSIGGGATGAAGDTVFQENQLIVTTSYTLSTGKSAMSVGPITINGGAAVTVPSGYRWVVL